ncbi:uncharacterized protein N7479_002857 [Penicillium vulpinum]|uniref:uncharacterized protein n=1 Tax=Penicillium vulpinum TaxID=29845 RepID=UPI0025485C7E|nr:uncharacterized protein N7479_002857 [Penicillium vulpinum]KAJ5972939.1 hypothetical protein N7479_002857 [Penicillium vulpinum]
MIDYGNACLCCGNSAIISAIWDTCPETKPSLPSADEWFNSVLIPGDWDECGPYLKAYDCASDLGYVRADAGANTKFYHPSSMPSNGTKTASNVGGVISAPVSGNTFSWTFGQTTNSVLHVVTVSSADATATGTKASAGSDATATSSATDTAESEGEGEGGSDAESDAKPGMGSSLIIPSWIIAGSAGVFMLLTL